jgi:hypothetical protein
MYVTGRDARDANTTVVHAGTVSICRAGGLT